MPPLRFEVTVDGHRFEAFLHGTEAQVKNILALDPSAPLFESGRKVSEAAQDALRVYGEKLGNFLTQELEAGLTAQVGADLAGLAGAKIDAEGIYLPKRQEESEEAAPAAPARDEDDGARPTYRWRFITAFPARSTLSGPQPLSHLTSRVESAVSGLREANVAFSPPHFEQAAPLPEDLARQRGLELAHRRQISQSGSGGSSSHDSAAGVGL